MQITLTPRHLSLSGDATGSPSSLVVSSVAGWAVADSITWFMRRMDSARCRPPDMHALLNVLRSEQLSIAAHALDQLADSSDSGLYRADYEELCTQLADAQAALLPRLQDAETVRESAAAGAACEVASPVAHSATASMRQGEVHANVSSAAVCSSVAGLSLCMQDGTAANEHAEALQRKLQAFCHRERYLALHAKLREHIAARVEPPKPLPLVMTRLPSLQKRCDPTSGCQPSDINELPDYVDRQLRDVRNVALVGMGGAGKTTIARAVFERAKPRFDRASFLVVSSQVTEASLQRLLEQAWGDILGGYSCPFADAKSGWQQLAHRCQERGLSVLLVLDDVWPHDRLAVLAALNFATHPSVRAAGSRLLVTTRHRHVLSNAPHATPVRDMPELLPVSVPELRPAQAEALFRQCAFGSSNASMPPHVPPYVVKQLAAGCQGNPLAVMVLAGTFSSSTPAPEWHQRLQQARRPLQSGEDEVSKRLQLSVDLLPPSLQECFIDFAAFPEDARVLQVDIAHLFATHAPLLSPHSRQAAAAKARALVDRHLIKELNHDQFADDRLCYQMHDVLHTIAQNMAAEPARKRHCGHNAASCSRKISDDVLHFAACQGSTLPQLAKGTRVRACCVTGNAQPPIKWLQHAHCLQFLWLQGWHASNIVRALDSVPDVQQLQFASLAGTGHLEAPPDSLWRFRQLAHLDLSYTYIHDLPASISSCHRLTALLLRDCLLHKLTQGIGGCTRLAHLDLIDSGWLAALPGSIGNCTLLTHLNLGKCTTLTALPEGISGCVQLKTLNLYSCQVLVTLPNNIGGCAQLRHLDLRECKALVALPEGIGGCTQLTHLDLFNCNMLAALPQSIGGCAQLALLNLRGCKALVTLPQGIGACAALAHLDLSGCEALAALPESIGGCAQLAHINLGGCKALTRLPEGIGGCAQLTHLDVFSCDMLAALPQSIGGCAQLAHLNLRGCKALVTLPQGIDACAQLAHLDLSGCEALAALPESIGGCAQLAHLDLGGCEALTGLPEGVGGCAQLTHLNLRWCEALAALPEGIGRCAQLAHLDLGTCQALEALPESIGGCTQLVHLTLSFCVALTGLPEGIGSCAQLARLDLMRCQALTALPEGIGGCTQLTHLDLYGCKALAALPEGIGECTLLQHLDLYYCASLSALPRSLAQCTRLTHLDLSYCDQLRETHECLSGCTQLEFVGLWACGLLAAPPLRIGRWDLAGVRDLAGVTHLGEPPADMIRWDRELLTNGLR